MSDTPMISLDTVTKVFPGAEHPAVDALSMEVSEGEVVVLVGPSGCGKTTTLKMINRLIEPTSGTITVAGQEVTSVPAPLLRRSIGYVIQQIGLFPHRTIGDNIATVPRLLGWDKAKVEHRIDELIELVDLDPEMRQRYPAELSGGQRQRVGVARALAADPPVLLMDEPFGAVDPIVRARLQDELLDLQSRVNKTIVVVTHDIDEAIKLGDRVAILNVGGILEQYDTPAEILRAPSDEFVEGFLGTDRGIKRLSLIPISTVDLVDGPVVEHDAPASAAVALMEQFGVEWFGIREGDTLHGWVSATELAAVASLAELEPQPFKARLGLADSLRDALETVITSHTQIAPVFDGDRYVGMLTTDVISREIAQ